MITLRELNAVSADAFVLRLAGVFEHSPWVAERAASGRPFESRLHLLDAMRAVVNQASVPEQLALIRAHPRLGVKGRPALELTAASAREQHRAGLEACTAQDFARLSQLNDAYFDKFGMPFILAVRGHDPASIIATCERRVANEPAAEQWTALREIGLIAGYRLADVIATPASVEILAMNERLDTAVDAGALVHEWMKAAELELSLVELSLDERANLVGLRHGTADSTETLMIGLHVDLDSGALVYDGRLGFLLGIALAQQLRQKGVWLPFDLAIVARPADPDRGDSARLADIDPAATGVKAVAGFGERPFAAARRIAPGSSGPLDAALVERAVFSLEDFLLHTEQMFDDHGTLHVND